MIDGALPGEVVIVMAYGEGRLSTAFTSPFEQCMYDGPQVCT